MQCSSLPWSEGLRVTFILACIHVVPGAAPCTVLSLCAVEEEEQCSVEPLYIPVPACCPAVTALTCDLAAFSPPHAEDTAGLIEDPTSCSSFYITHPSQHGKRGSCSHRRGSSSDNSLISLGSSSDCDLVQHTLLIHKHIAIHCMRAVMPGA